LGVLSLVNLSHGGDCETAYRADDAIETEFGARSPRFRDISVERSQTQKLFLSRLLARLSCFLVNGEVGASLLFIALTLFFLQLLSFPKANHLRAHVAFFIGKEMRATSILCDAMRDNDGTHKPETDINGDERHIKRLQARRLSAGARGGERQ
jgi:hypothetical protein